MDRVDQLILKFTFVVTTRNRYSDLNQTLNRFLQLGLSEFKFLIINDASDQAWVNPGLLESFKNVIVISNSSRKGLIANRNLAIKKATTPYVINFDDDSCFISCPDFSSILTFFDVNADVAAIEFRNIEARLDGVHELPVCGRVPYSVQCFTGCGNVLRTSAVLKVGMFDESFFQMCEERDLCARLYKYGYKVVCLPDILVLHRKTPVQRIRKDLVYFSVRNTCWMTWRNDPAVLCATKLLLMLPYQLLWHRKELTVWFDILIGYISGVGTIGARKRARDPMSNSQYAKLHAYPVSGLVLLTRHAISQIEELQL